MNVEQFINKPHSSIHKAYENSFLHMRPAPEYANGEVVLASTYRQLSSKVSHVSESSVPKLGRALNKRLEKGKRPSGSAGGTNIEAEDWKQIVTGTLRSPKQPNQASKRFLQISPVVPDASIYSLSARLSANSWNPGALVAKLVQFGSASPDEAQSLWSTLFQALDIDEQDDLWARFLSREFGSWREGEHTQFFSQPSILGADTSVSGWQTDARAMPAQQFVFDLKSIIDLKKHLTRRQWISMLESLLRLGCASHVMWTSSANTSVFSALMRVLNGEDPDATIRSIGDGGINEGYLRLGQYSASALSEIATGFIKSRLGINLLLCSLEEKQGSEFVEGTLENFSTIEALIRKLPGSLESVDIQKFRQNYQNVLESDHRLISGRKGIASNLKEFLRHVLGQRQTSEPGLDSYDQGYFLAKRGLHKSARWEVSIGPVAVLSLVHACTHDRVGTRNVDDFCRHIKKYGITVSVEDLARSSLGLTLRNLGLILDSPDAEGGMVIVSPFESILRGNS